MQGLGGRVVRTGKSAYQREPSGSASMRCGDLVDGVALDARAAYGAEGLADAREEQAQEIVDSVEVATVERGLRVVFFWRMATAGAMPSISSTSGFSMRSRNWRA